MKIHPAILTKSACSRFLLNALLAAAVSLFAFVLYRKNDPYAGWGMTGFILFITFFPIAIHQSVIFIQAYLTEAFSDLRAWRRNSSGRNRGCMKELQVVMAEPIVGKNNYNNSSHKGNNDSQSSIYSSPTAAPAAAAATPNDTRSDEDEADGRRHETALQDDITPDDGTAVEYMGEPPTCAHTTDDLESDFATIDHTPIYHKLYLALFFFALAAVIYFTIGCLGFFRLGFELVRCGYIFCPRDPDHYSTTYETGSNVLFGMILGVLMCPLGGLLMVQLAWRVWTSRALIFLNRRQREDSIQSSDTSATSSQASCSWQQSPFCHFKHRSAYKRVALLLVALVLFLVAAVLTFYLPNDFHKISAKLLATTAASYATANGTKTANLMVTELPNAIFRTSNIRVSSRLVLKLYPGNVCFYVYLMLLFSLGMAVRWSHKGRSWFQRRLRRFPKWTWGEVCIVCITLLMCVVFCIYWLHDHNYKQAWTSANADGKSKMNVTERTARGLGQVAVLFLSLLLFPLSRNSLIHECFGTTWETFLKFHRLCGYAMTIATLAHMIVFFVSYHQQGYLLHNLFHLPTYVGYKGVHTDFTVMAITYVSFIMFITIGIFAFYPMRRRFYELFYYTHILTSAMMVPLTILHASAAWMYMLPGMTLWCVDQMVRLWQKGTQVEVLSSRLVGDDVVEIVFNVPKSRMQKRTYAGQYMFFNVPAISVLQWHPLTLTCGANFRSDAPGSSSSQEGCDTAGAPAEAGKVYTIYVKSMGEGTWSGQLCEYVKTGRAAPMTMGVDGPYGTPVDFDEFDEVYFFAGGVGITPCATLYHSVMRNKDLLRRVKKVRLVWATRSTSLISALSGQLGLPDVLQLLSEPTTAAGTPGPVDREAPPQEGQPQEGDAAVPVQVTDDGTCACECHLYVTERRAFAKVQGRLAADGELGAEASKSESVTRVFQGRPIVARELDCDAASVTAGDDVDHKNIARGRTMLFICGPEKLSEEAIRVGAMIGAHVHVEEFYF